MRLQPDSGHIRFCAATLRFVRIELVPDWCFVWQASTDFAGEAARLSAALQQREQDLRFTGTAALMLCQKHTVLLLILWLWCLAISF